MKNKLTSILMMTLGGLALAAPLQPNLFECHGDNLDVSYTTSNMVGKPTFSVRKGSEEALSFLDKQIRTQETVLGKLVTVTTANVPDRATLTATLVVPTVNLSLGRGAMSADFDTVLIETASRTSIAGPALVQGAVESSVYVPVKCTARAVQF